MKLHQRRAHLRCGKIGSQFRTKCIAVNDHFINMEIEHVQLKSGVKRIFLLGNCDLKRGIIQIHLYSN